MKRLPACGALAAALLSAFQAGCGNGRDTSTLPASLMGHWVTESGATHYYFDGGTVVMVDLGCRTELDYAVVQVDEPANSMRIAVSQPGRGGHEKLLEFSAGRDSLLETIEISGSELSTGWVFVDSLTRPEADVSR